MFSISRDQVEKLSDLCREFGVNRLDLFGSAATEDFDPERSDLDFLVEFPRGQDLGPWMRNLSRFRTELSSLFDRQAEVVMATAKLDLGFRQEVERTRTPLYHAPEIAKVAE